MNSLFKRDSYRRLDEGNDDSIAETSSFFKSPTTGVQSTDFPLDDKPKTYKRRWIVLFSFMALSIINNLTQYSFAPISAITLGHYGINPFDLDILAIVFMVSGFTTRFLGMWILDSKGLGVGVIIATILNFIGCWLRWWPGYKSYNWVLIGQSFCAAAMSFIDIAGPKVAANWFAPSERTTATALASGPIFLAMLISYSIVPRFVTSGNDIPGYLLVQAIVSSAASVFVLIFFRDHPPTPPSYSAAVDKLSFIETFKVLIRKPNFFYLFFAFSIDLGFAVSFSVLMDQIVGPAGYTNVEAGLLGSIWIGCAIFGGIVAGPIIDKTHAYKVFMISSMFLVIISLIVFTLMLEFMAKSMVSLGIVVGFMGLGGASLPALLESTIEVVFPIPEASAMGVLFLGLNVTAIIFTLGMEKLKDSKTGAFILPLWISIGLIVISAVTMFLFKGDYKRLEYEESVKEQTYSPEKWVTMEPTEQRTCC